MARHLTQTELGQIAYGLGSLDWQTLAAGVPVIWDFDNRTLSNAVITLDNPVTTLRFENVPDGAMGNLIVSMGSNPANRLEYDNITIAGNGSADSTPESGVTRDLIPRIAGGRTLLQFIKHTGNIFYVTSTYIGVYRQDIAGLVPGWISGQEDHVLKAEGQWGLIDLDNISDNAKNWLRNRANHTGTQTTDTISDLRNFVTNIALHEFELPQGDIDMNGYGILNLRYPKRRKDAVNYETLTMDDQLILFMQVFS